MLETTSSTHPWTIRCGWRFPRTLVIVQELCSINIRFYHRKRRGSTHGRMATMACFHYVSIQQRMIGCDLISSQPWQSSFSHRKITVDIWNDRSCIILCPSHNAEHCIRSEYTTYGVYLSAGPSMFDRANVTKSAAIINQYCCCEQYLLYQSQSHPVLCHER